MKTAVTLSGGSQTPSTCSISATLLEVANHDGELDVALADPHDLLTVESEYAALTDIIDSDVARDNEFDSMDYVTDTPVVMVWEAPEVRTIVLLIFLLVISF